MREHGVPICRLDHDVEESVHGVAGFHGRFVFHEPAAYFVGNHGGSLAGKFNPGKHHNSEIALKLLASCGRHDFACGGIGVVEPGHGF